MQADCGRGAGHVPAMIRQLFGQIRHLEFPLGLAKILFAHSVVLLVAAMLVRNRLAMHDLRGQVFNSNLFPAAKHQAPFQCVLQLAHIARPIVFLNGRHRRAL